LSAATRRSPERRGRYFRFVVAIALPPTHERQGRYFRFFVANPRETLNLLPRSLSSTHQVASSSPRPGRDGVDIQGPITQPNPHRNNSVTVIKQTMTASTCLCEHAHLFLKCNVKRLLHGGHGHSLWCHSERSRLQVGQYRSA
jgi:hypothetical protein